MSRKHTKARRDSFKRNERAVREILNRWDPLPGSPSDEYDCLTHLILSELHRGASESAVEALIAHEMHDHFGLDVSPSEVASVAREVGTWWRAAHPS